MPNISVILSVDRGGFGLVTSISIIGGLFLTLTLYL